MGWATILYIEELKFINPQEMNEEDGVKRAGISESTPMKNGKGDGVIVRFER